MTGWWSFDVRTAASSNSSLMIIRKVEQKSLNLLIISLFFHLISSSEEGLYHSLRVLCYTQMIIKNEVVELPRVECLKENCGRKVSVKRAHHNQHHFLQDFIPFWSSSTSFRWKNDVSRRILEQHSWLNPNTWEDVMKRFLSLHYLTQGRKVYSPKKSSERIITFWSKAK